MKVKNVKEMLSELKDLCVLSVDLAYCAILFGSKEIAKEVMHIEEEADKLRDEIEKETLKAARHEKAKELMGLLRLATSSEMITDISAEIVKELLEGTAVHEVERKALNDAKEKFFMQKINRAMMVKEIEEKHKADVLAVKRKNKWIYKPKAETILLKGDLVVALRP